MKHTGKIGIYVKKLSLEQNVSISRLSDILQCSKDKVELFLEDEAIPSYSQLEILSEFFNVSISDLIKGGENK